MYKNKKILMIYSKCLMLKWQMFDILAKTVKLLHDQNKNGDDLVEYIQYLYG